MLYGQFALQHPNVERKIRVKYTEKYSHDGYQFKEFDSYTGFGEWFCKNFKKIDIWNIEDKEN